MVKIRELSDKQLLGQLEKYEKIYTQLLTEREKRVSSRGGNPKGLLTTKEQEEQVKAKKVEAAPVQEEKTEAFHLKFDDDEINAMEEQEANRQQSEDEDDEVRVTQLLKLSKEQLEELRSPQPKKVVKKKKVLKKKV